MKKLFTLFAFTLSTALCFGQPLFTETFEAYQGFGTTLTADWPTSGFKVYLNHGNNASKGCGTLFNNNHKSDSLTSPDLGSITGGVQVSFDARLGGDIIGNTPTAGYLPTASDHIWFLSSVDGGPYQMVQELTNQFTNTTAAFSNLSVNIPESSTNSMRLKVKVLKGQTLPSTEFYMDVDNFAVSLLTANKARQNTEHSIQVLPNPTSGLTTLVLGEGWTSKAVIEVYNILGNKVWEGTNLTGKIQIDLSAQNSGIYMVKVSEGKVSQLKRLIVK